MTDEEARIVDAIHALIEANDRAREQIDATNALLRCGIDQLQAGTGVIEALKVLPVASRRQSTQDAFQLVVTMRHRLRLQAIGACTTAGMSPAQIAEIWGVSRQRVAQCVAELQKREAAAAV